MTWWTRLFGCVAVTVHVLSGAVCVAQDGAEPDREPEPLPLQDVRIPLTQYPDGSVKTQLKAEGARISEDGNVEARVIRLEFLTPGGGLEAVVEAEECTFDRESEVARSGSHISIIRRNVLITGRGFEWNAKDEMVKIIKDTRVVFRHETPDGKPRTPTW